MESITIVSGNDKDGNPENIDSLTFKLGECIAIVGNTGAGKSRLIKDIEHLSCKDTITKRRILIDGKEKKHLSPTATNNMVAHLGQNMRFILDISVKEFFKLHSKCKGIEVNQEEVLNLANQITAEKVKFSDNLNQLSGGQTRAVMIADIAKICNSPIVLIDEIENAGIDKEMALNILLDKNKLVIAVTHDPLTALIANKRIMVANGGIQTVCQTSQNEHLLKEELTKQYKAQRILQEKLRKGSYLI